MRRPINLITRNAYSYASTPVTITPTLMWCPQSEPNGRAARSPPLRRDSVVKRLIDLIPKATRLGPNLYCDPEAWKFSRTRTHLSTHPATHIPSTQTASWDRPRVQPGEPAQGYSTNMKDQ